jgi:uncharacterized membrane protein
MDDSVPTRDHQKLDEPDETEEEQQTREISREELQDLRNSTVLKFTGLLMLLNIPLALWVLLGSLGFVPFDIAVFWGWLGLIVVIGLLQLHPTIRRAREVSKTLRRFEQID